MFKKIIHRLVMECLWRVPLPVRTDPFKVVGSSFSGLGYGDNPAAVIDNLRQDKRYRAYWIVKDEQAAASLPTGITALRINRLRAIFHLRTAGFWIDNCRKMPFVRKRADQHYVQTWHGFALKRIEADAVDKLKPGYARTARHDSRMIDIIVSNSRFMSDIYRSGFWYDGKLLQVGSPRNDLLFDTTAPAIATTRSALGLEPGVKVALYAPTFRSDMSLDAYDLDYEKLRTDLTAAFGGRWVIAIRLHSMVAARSAELGVFDDPHVIDASAYPNTQHLLALADTLITDYSSMMFDFMLTTKPVFLYANDTAAYKKDRGFYYPLESLPFSVAKTQQQLSSNIKRFKPDTYRKSVDRFIDTFGVSEYGTASAAVVDWIKEQTPRA